MYAIRNKKTKKWVYGTDYRHRHPKKDGRPSFQQRTSFNQALTFEDIPSADLEFKIRGCGRDYEIAEVILCAKDNLFCSWKWENIFKGELNG